MRATHSRRGPEACPLPYSVAQACGFTGMPAAAFCPKHAGKVTDSPAAATTMSPLFRLKAVA